MSGIVNIAVVGLSLWHERTGNFYRHNQNVVLDHVAMAGLAEELAEAMKQRIQKHFVFNPPEGGSVFGGLQNLDSRRFQPIIIQGEVFQSLAAVSPGYLGLPAGGGYVVYVTADLDQVAAELGRRNVPLYANSQLYGRRALQVDLDATGSLRAYVTDRNFSDTVKALSLPA